MKESIQDGANEWSDFLPGTSLLPQNNTKPPGVHLRGGDQGDGKLAQPNPLFIGSQLKVPSVHRFHGTPSWADSVQYRNRMAEIRHELFDFTTDFRLTGERVKRSSVPLPNLLPLTLLQSL